MAAPVRRPFSFLEADWELWEHFLGVPGDTFGALEKLLENFGSSHGHIGSSHGHIGGTRATSMTSGSKQVNII